jgi:signal transduction histidine kinase
MPVMNFDRDTTCAKGSPLKLKPWNVILKDKDHGWSPLLWVVYLGFFFMDPVMSHAGLRIWLLDLLAAVVFLLLYFGLFALEYPRAIVHVGGMVALGLLLQPINSGSCTFFIYAAAMLPFCVETQTAAVLGLGAIGVIGAIGPILRHDNGWVLFYSSLFPVIIGAGNTFFAERNRMNRKLRKANDEIEHLAKVAERERIARDLHDVLGHTLSVITLKSELAGKLIDRDPRAGGKRDPRSRTDLAAGFDRCARRDSRLPFPGTGGGAGASQVDARNRRPYCAVRRRDHSETAGDAGERPLARRS